MFEHTPLYNAALKVVQRIGQGRAFFVGGACRDSLLELPLKDIDIATELGSKQVMSLFPGSELIGADFGVVLVKQNGFHFEVAAFRKESSYSDKRHPDKVTFGTIYDDVKRRDFTINALYYDPIKEEIIDLVGGQQDLAQGVLRCVGNAHDRLSEDALRILRAVRFVNRLNFEWDHDLKEAVSELSPNLLKISAERVKEELDRILTGPDPAMALDLMRECGILQVILPEIATLEYCEQSPVKHPEGRVFLHTALTVKNIKPRDTVHVWSALLHDVAKPICFAEYESFHGHAEMGATMSEAILTRLKFSNDEKEMIVSTVRDHMKFLDIKKMRKSTLRRFMSKPHFQLTLDLHRADCESSSGEFDNVEYIEQKKQEFVQEDGAVLPDPLITGHQVMERLGIAQGPLVGQILRKIQDAQLESIITTEVGALSYADALLEQHEQGELE